MIHLFCDCKIVDAFWNDVFDWILARFRINVPSNNFHKLFGFHTQYVNNPLVNHMLLLARFLIYQCKHSKTTPNMPQYFNAITSTKKSEHYIAKKHNKLEFHYKKWSSYIYTLHLCFVVVFIFVFLFLCLQYKKKKSLIEPSLEKIELLIIQKQHHRKMYSKLGVSYPIVGNLLMV